MSDDHDETASGGQPLITVELIGLPLAIAGQKAFSSRACRGIESNDGR